MKEQIMDFIRAERTGNWLLHLKCLEKIGFGQVFSKTKL